MTQEATTVRPVRASLVEHWDRTADVVVVGFGCAGAAAAIEASVAGARVLVIERAGGWGGASSISSGQIYLGGGTDLQRSCGFEDSAEAMYRFLEAVVGPGHDEDKLRRYCDGSVEHYDWLVGCGVRFKPVFYDGGYRPSVADGGLMFSGGENAAPWDRIARPAPRSHTPCVGDPHRERKGGWSLMSALAAEVGRRGAEVAYDVAVRRLVVDDGGVVQGLIARSGGRDVAIRADRAIVLTAGGFAFNDEMVRRHAPMIARCTRLGTDGDDGRGIRMAQAAGAAVKHMGASVSAFGVKAGALAPSILVSRSGQRFINEDTYYGRVAQTVLLKHDGTSFLVLDEDTFERIDADSLQGRRPTWVCDTVAELAAEMGVPCDALVNTVTFYNEHAAAGEDPLFGKRATWLQPLRAPFGAIELPVESLSVFTAGGLDTTADGHVLDLDGAPIPGLYAAGRTTSGLAVSGYVSGLSLGDGTFFGRRAGRAAATG
jgi:3-oxo-5alpha-steroid 4-dehydrogenase